MNQHSEPPQVLPVSESEEPRQKPRSGIVGITAFLVMLFGVLLVLAGAALVGAVSIFASFSFFEGSWLRAALAVSGALTAKVACFGGLALGVAFLADEGRKAPLGERALGGFLGVFLFPLIHPEVFLFASAPGALVGFIAGGADSQQTVYIAILALATLLGAGVGAIFTGSGHGPADGHG